MWTVLPFVALALYLGEFVRPVVPRRRIRSWVWRVWSLNVAQIPVAMVVAALWGSMSHRGSLLDLSHRLPSCAAGGVAYVVYTFVFYWWHRARHASDLVWRSLHQIHHSATRLELVTAFYKHPLETFANAALAAVVLFPLLGLDVAGAVTTTCLAAIADLFYHANVRTPAWIGWIVQRPEMHRQHHERGRHEGNYGDLPLWDWLFGTLRLPGPDPVACGFDPGLEEKLVPMMLFDDVHEQR